MKMKHRRPRREAITTKGESCKMTAALGSKLCPYHDPNSLAFANAAGGQIIYGMKENKDHLPDGLDAGIDPAEFPGIWFEHVIQQNASPQIDGLSHQGSASRRWDGSGCRCRDDPRRAGSRAPALRPTSRAIRPKLDHVQVLQDLTVAPVPRPARFALVELSETSNDPCNRTAACMRARLGECVCQRTSGRHASNTRRGQRRFNGRRAAWWIGASAEADDICRALEQSAAENALPVEFFARVIWQESRFDVQAVSPKGAAGIAQFMPATASWHGLADPFDPVEALRHSAAYLRELLNRFGNLGLAAAAYNAGPARVSAWLTNHRALPAETHNYVALVTAGQPTNGHHRRRQKTRRQQFRKAYLAPGLPI